MILVWYFLYLLGRTLNLDWASARCSSGVWAFDGTSHQYLPWRGSWLVCNSCGSLLDSAPWKWLFQCCRHLKVWWLPQIAQVKTRRRVDWYLRSCAGGCESCFFCFCLYIIFLLWLYWSTRWCQAASRLFLELFCSSYTCFSIHFLPAALIFLCLFFAIL